MQIGTSVARRVVTRRLPSRARVRHRGGHLSAIEKVVFDWFVEARYYRRGEVSTEQIAAELKFFSVIELRRLIARLAERRFLDVSGPVVQTSDFVPRRPKGAAWFHVSDRSP